jgi:hypothetical protein
VLKFRLLRPIERSVERGANGGFPEPLAGQPVRLVRCKHEACGVATRVRLPRALPARAVRRVLCDGCREPYECEHVLEVGDAEPRARRWLSEVKGRAWRYLSVPVAAALVIGALFLIQGRGEPTRPSASPAASAASGPSKLSGDGARHARVVKGSSFTLALPPGWQRTGPKSGATFAAASSDGDADATLWIRRDPKLGFPAFEAHSLAQLHALAGSARVVDRVTAPTAAGTVVTLAADSPPGQPAYEVTLRVAGPYRYYLATTVEPNASRRAVDGAELLHNSFVPAAGGKAGQ